MRFACCITTATDTHSQYVMLIAFQLQQWLHERASMLLLYVHSPSCVPSVGHFGGVLTVLYGFGD
jgi:hypothetical protein